MVGILIVSHSEKAAEGIAEIAIGMSSTGRRLPIVAVGGNDHGGLGVSVTKVYEALAAMLPKADEGVVILPDLGSSVLSSRAAIEMLSPDDAKKIVIADAPVLEGAMVASVEASAGSSLEEVLEAAKEARNLNKTDN